MVIFRFLIACLSRSSKNQPVPVIFAGMTMKIYLIMHSLVLFVPALLFSSLAFPSALSRAAVIAALQVVAALQGVELR
jgi:hypothetical protein